MEQGQESQRRPGGVATYPLVLTNLGRQRCVVVGGGAVAERKVCGLIAGGARPLVISPTLTPQLAAWHAAGLLEYLDRPYREGDLDGAFVIVAATNDRAVNAQIAARYAEQPVLLNIVDDPPAGTMHTVATVRSGDLLLTVSTGGADPRRAARVRRELAERYGEDQPPAPRPD
jgi:siroheme synthase-like protein